MPRAEFNLHWALGMAFMIVIVGMVIIVLMTPAINYSTLPTRQYTYIPPTSTLPSRAIMTLTALGHNLTHTANFERTTQAQFTPPAPESIEMTLTQAVENATQGTLSLLVTPHTQTP